MSVTVTPQTFNFVAYDAALIQRVAEELLASLGLADRDLNIEVDETTPLARTRVEVGDAISIRAESGAFEDTRRPRQQSEVATATSLGRVLLRVRDRLNGGFGDAPPDEDLTLAQVAAWETYCSRQARAAGHRRQPAALALQLPQPPRLHRRSRRGVQPLVGRRRPDVGRARGNLCGSRSAGLALMTETTVSDIDVNGVTLRVHQAGDPANPTVVLCHGFPELAYSWRHQMAPLAEAGFHVIAPDQRGYGHSSAPTRDRRLRHREPHRRSAGLLDHFGKDDAVFVGHDWGALIVWDLARLHPERVRAVVGVSVPFVSGRPRRRS